MGLPKLTKDGVLPQGLHRASLAEVRHAFGAKTARRVELMMALEEALEHARKAGVLRVLINGSFVTRRKEPRDVDVVFQVSDVFAGRLSNAHPDAVWVRQRLREAAPKLLDVFLAVDDAEWASWVSLFEGDTWSGKKGLVEVVL